MDSFSVTLITKLIRIRGNTRPKLCYFGHYVVGAKLLCLERFVPVTGPVVFIWENFHPVTEISPCDLSRKNRDLMISNRASPASHMNTSIRP